MKKTFNEKVSEILKEIADILKEKNKSYGESALDPIGIFFKGDSNIGLRARIDDKLARLQKGDNPYEEDVIIDLIGYLILLKISEKEKNK